MKDNKEDNMEDNMKDNMEDNIEENGQECDGAMKGCAICKEHPGWGQHTYVKTYSSRITDKMLADAVEFWTNTDW